MVNYKIIMSDLKKAFGYIISSQTLDNSLIDIGEIISRKGISTSRKDCLQVLSVYGVDDIKKFTDTSLKLVMFYLKVVLKDNLISDEELRNIRFLKLLFGIKEGDFNKQKGFANEVVSIIKSQLNLIYVDDEVSSQEAIHKVNLQEVFGLNYDEFLLLSNQVVLDSLSRGYDWIEIDSFITANAYDIWVEGNESSTNFEIQEIETRSRHISQSTKDDVWNRDDGKCVECGSKEDLEFDHIIPHSKGGANTYRNIQLLCEPCNRSKSAKIG